MTLAFAMACILAVWGGLFLLCAGLGLGLLRAGCGSRSGPADLVLAAWIGYAAALAALQVWHFALPVDARALAALAAASLAGWLAGLRGPGRKEGGEDFRWPRSVVVLTALLALWVADRAAGPGAGYDSANYHLTLVRWFDSFPVVPGLANLNPVYGVNLSGLLFPALLEQGPGTGRSSHFANGFVLVLFFLLVARRIGELLASREMPTPGRLFAAVLVYPAVMIVNRGNGVWVSSLTTDVPASLTVLAACCLAVEALGDGRPREEAEPRLFAALLLLSVTPCLKATAGIFAAAAWIVVLGAALVPRRRAAVRPLVIAVAFALAAGVPWLARNVLLSGYPLFPSTAAAFDVDWRLPAEHGTGMVWWTRAYTRTPGAWDRMLHQDATNWLPYWLRVELRPALHEGLVPLLLTAVWIALWLAAGRPRPRHAPVLLLPLAVALPAWFVLAPAFRYGLFLFWVLCAQAAALLLPPVLAAAARRRALVGPAVLVLAAAPLAFQAWYGVRYRGADPPGTALARLFFTPPGPDHGFHPLPAPPLETVRVCGGVRVFLPRARPGVSVDSAPWPATLPWDAPLPATSLLLDGLCARRPGDLGAGFRIDQGGQSWPRRNAASVRAVSRRTGWGLARLAVHFCVRPELIQESLRSRR